MNEPAAYAEFDAATGYYYGWFRPVWKADDIQVCRDGKPMPFHSRKDAELAAWRAKHEYENPVMTRCGERVKAIGDAHALFRPGKKPIQVEVI